MRYHWSVSSLVLASSWLACAAWPAPAPASEMLCNPTVLGEVTVATTAQTIAAGKRVVPQSIIGPTGFDWNDTELGAFRSADGSHLTFLASDGSCHRACNRPRERDGSIVLTQGSLDHPLGRGAPVETIIGKPGVTLPTYMLYAGGGGVYRVPAGHPAAGGLLLVYQAARASYQPGYHYPDCDAQGFCNAHQNGFYSYIGLAASRDEGATWRDFGLIIAVNQPYDPQLTVDIGNGNLIADPPDSPTPQFFRIYFPDRLKAKGQPGGIITRMSVARAPYTALLRSIERHATLPPFEKYHGGAWKEPGIGGVSTDLIAEPSHLNGDMFIAWNAAAHRYAGIFDNTEKIRYVESADGLAWSRPVTLAADIRPRKDSALYATALGTGQDPNVLGQQFYVFYNFQRDGYGWGSTELRRMQIFCQGRP
jgi:hypothetical protein